MLRFGFLGMATLQGVVQTAFLHPSDSEKIIQTGKKPVADSVFGCPMGSWKMLNGDFSHRKPIHLGQALEKTGACFKWRKSFDHSLLKDLQGTAVSEMPSCTAQLRTWLAILTTIDGPDCHVWFAVAHTLNHTVPQMEGVWQSHSIILQITVHGGNEFSSRLPESPHRMPPFARDSGLK